MTPHLETFRMWVLLHPLSLGWLKQFNIGAFICIHELRHAFLNSLGALLIVCHLFLQSPLLTADPILDTHYLSPDLSDIVL